MMMKTNTPTIFEQVLFQTDMELLEHPSAKPAIIQGALRAKRAALRTVTLLGWLNWPLLISFLAVSFLHVAWTLLLISPEGTPTWDIDKGWYNTVQLLNTGIIDAAAFFLVAVGATAKLAGKTAGRARWFFIALTTLANANYYLLNAPGVSEQFEPYKTEMMWAIVVFLSLLIGVGIASLEGARHVLEAIRLPLMAEVTTYEAIAKAHEGEEPYEVKQLREDFRIVNDRATKLEQTINKVAQALGAAPDSDVVSLAEAAGRSREVIERLEIQIEELLEREAGLQTAVQRYEDYLCRIADALGERIQEGDIALSVEKLVERARQAGRGAEQRNGAATVKLAETEVEQVTPPEPTYSRDDLLAKAVSVQTVAKDGAGLTCEVCNGEMDANDKSIGARKVWKLRFNSKIACRKCREAWKAA